MYGVVVVQPGVALANQSSNPRSPTKRNSLAVKLPSEIHVMQARHTHPAFGAFLRKFQPNYSQYLQLQGGHSRPTESLFCTEGDVNTEIDDKKCLFGEEVDDGAMEAEFGMAPKKQVSRARLALRLMKDDEKKEQAYRYVANLKDKYGCGSSTLCLVYNATGDTLHRYTYHDFEGKLHHPRKYPTMIRNGQWAAFLHVQRTDPTATGSAGAVVYRGKNRHNEERDFVLAWYTPSSLRQNNKAYCSIGAAVVSYDEGVWKNIYNTLDKCSYTCRSLDDDVVEADVQTERGTSPTFTAIIKSVRDDP